MLDSFQLLLGSKCILIPGTLNPLLGRRFNIMHEYKVNLTQDTMNLLMEHRVDLMQYTENLLFGRGAKLIADTLNLQL